MAQHCGYGSGHPWYYHLGGPVLRPRQILEEVCLRGYPGYARDDIEAADRMAEPRRSETLRAYQARFQDDLRRDLARYRQCVRHLHTYRQKHERLEPDAICDGVHIAVSLKHNHLINDFAHLIYLNELLTRQGDLFDF
jgi:hypothetical protein